MRKYLYIICFLLTLSCNKEDAGDCFQTSGNIIQREVVVSSFDKILVNKDVELILREGVEYQVIIETGKNLFNDVKADVVDGRLILTDNNSCNYVRNYGITKIFVTAPNITEIRSSTQYDISSDGILTYPSLAILSENFGALESYAVGDFKLKIDNESFSLVFNNISNCYISGKTNYMNLSFASGDSRFEGSNLMAQYVTINHRGTNDMIINPQERVEGVISSYGNVISKNLPSIVEVEELFKGKLIFE